MKCVRVPLAGSVALLSPTQRWSPATVSVFSKVRRPSSLKLLGKNAHGNWSQHVAAKCGVGNASEQPISARTWIFSVFVYGAEFKSLVGWLWLMMIWRYLGLSNMLGIIKIHYAKCYEPISAHRFFLDQIRTKKSPGPWHHGSECFQRDKFFHLVIYESRGFQTSKSTTAEP